MSTPQEPPKETSGLPPLENFVKKSMLPTSPEAIEHFERARNIETKDGDKSALAEQAGELALAIKKANGVFPAAHVLLGLALFQMGDEQRGLQELNLAVQQDNCNVLARAFLLMVDVEKLGMPNVPRNTGSLLVDLAGLGIGMGVAQNKLSKLSNRIDQLVKAYFEDISGSTNVEFWIGRGELMLQAHDSVQGIKALPKKDRLATAVVNTPWDRLTIPTELVQKVNDLKRRAEGRALLAK